MQQLPLLTPATCQRGDLPAAPHSSHVLTTAAELFIGHAGSTDSQAVKIKCSEKGSGRHRADVDVRHIHTIGRRQTKRHSGYNVSCMQQTVRPSRTLGGLLAARCLLLLLLAVGCGAAGRGKRGAGRGVFISGGGASGSLVSRSCRQSGGDGGTGLRQKGMLPSRLTAATASCSSCFTQRIHSAPRRYTRPLPTSGPKKVAVEGGGRYG